MESVMTLVIEFSNPTIRNGKWVECFTQMLHNMTDAEMVAELKRCVETEWREGVRYRISYVSKTK